MRRCTTLVLFSCVGRGVSHWNDGNEGQEWKARFLNDRRQVALDYLLNANRRQSIHDAIRVKANQSKQRLVSTDKGSSATVLQESLASFEPDECPSDSELLERINEIFMDECSVDSFENIPLEELKFLRKELYDADTVAERRCEDKALKAWLGLRKESSEIESFSSLPKDERTLWSPWYLRDVHSRVK